MAEYNLSAVLSVKDGFTATINKFSGAVKKTAFNAQVMESSFSKMDRSITNTLKKGASSVMTYSKNIALGLGAVTVATGGFALSTAADMETYSSMLDTAFKGNQDKVKDYFKWANKFANETPFSNKEVMESTVKLSMRGLDPKKVMGTVGDLAASMGKPLEQATEAVLDAMTGELERLKEFGITKDMIIKEGEKLGFKDLVDSKGSISDTKKFMDVTFKLMERMTKGAMAKQANTFKGLMSTITGTAQFAMSRFAGIQEDGTIRIGSAFDLIKNRLKGFTDKLNTAVEDGTIERWTKKFDELAQKGMKAFDELILAISSIKQEDIDTWADNTKKGFQSVLTIADALADTIRFLSDNINVLKYGVAALGGAKTGALIGSFIPGVGTAIGAGVGAGVGLLGMGAFDLSKTRPNTDAPVLPERFDRKNNIMTNVQNTSRPITINITGNNTFNNTGDVDDFAKRLQENLMLQQ